MELLAHFNKEKHREQSLQTHCHNVGLQCSAACKSIGLEKLGLLAGLLHDAGKATQLFQHYLREQNPALKGTINHSSCGARFLAEAFGTQTNVAGLTAALVACAICGHHSGLPDCTSLTGEDLLSSRIFPKKETHYEEAVAAFTQNCFSKEELGRLFKEAQREVLRLFQRCKSQAEQLPAESQKSQLNFWLGLVARYLHSSLIDADRYDTYLFEAEQTYCPQPDLMPLWERLACRLEAHLGGLPKDSTMDDIRAQISDACHGFAQHGPGVYQLYVPTGGGKTYSSMRFSLQHALMHPQIRHIFYIAPFKTILEQNAKDLREVFEEDTAILEHHSDVILEPSSKTDGDAALERYQLLTQRWDSPLIFTTMVQFLNTLFSGRSACARRFHALANSVILLDEVQSVPVRFISMLNAALNFLAYQCGCTVILCTATQPELAGVPVPVLLAEPVQMVPQALTSFSGFHRTEIVDKTDQPAMNAQELAEFLMQCQQEAQSVLAVLNTKEAARRVYLEATKRSPELAVYYLSTALCPAHRISLLEEIKEGLEQVPMLCISTQLIEAGVNISFGCAVRSLTGLASIAQTAGRCNRHGEEDCRNVYIIKCAEENLSHLKDIVAEQDAVQPVLNAYRAAPARFDHSLLSPAAVRAYYRHYYHDREGDLDYPVTSKDDSSLFRQTSLYSLLSCNDVAWSEAQLVGKTPPNPLNQMFETAGAIVEVIEQSGIDVIVPYEDGRKSIAALLANPPYAQIPRLLREAQRYTVHLYENTRMALQEQNALYSLGETGAVALDERFYNPMLGVQTERGLLTALFA